MNCKIKNKRILTTDVRGYETIISQIKRTVTHFFLRQLKESYYFCTFQNRVTMFHNLLKAKVCSIPLSSDWMDVLCWLFRSIYILRCQEFSVTCTPLCPGIRDFLFSTRTTKGVEGRTSVNGPTSCSYRVCLELLEGLDSSVSTSKSLSLCQSQKPYILLPLIPDVPLSLKVPKRPSGQFRSRPKTSHGRVFFDES